MSETLILIIDSTVKSIIIIVALLGGFAYTTVLERRFIARLQSRIGPNRAGPWGLLQPVADGIKLFFKEDIVPAQANKVLFTLAPAITAIPALIVLAVVPLGKEVNVFGHVTSLGFADVNVGVLYIVSVTSIAVYGVVLAGWSSANKYAMMGGLRASAQMISYELSLGLSILAPVMMAGSMSLGDIIEGQKGLWYIFLQPLAAFIAYTAFLAEVNRSPFDLPEAEQELVAGYHSEYSGMKFAGFFMAEYMKMICVSAIFATLFLGGYQFFGMENWLGGWMGLFIIVGKVIASLMFMIWLRATLPRFRYDHLMNFGWKVLLPLSLLNIVITAVLVAFGIFPVSF